MRPSIETQWPDCRVFAHLTTDSCTLYIDTSGEPLFKRGWRQDKGDAPLKETLAAAMLAASGWWNPETGEVSAAMLTEIDTHGVVLGHSERREYFNETDKALSHKLPAALAAGLHPILCVGETEDERENGDTERKLRHQVQEGLDRLTPEQIAQVTIAYEPALISMVSTPPDSTPHAVRISS